MSATLLAVALSLFSAVAYAAAAVAQERLARRDTAPGVLHLLRSGPWWGAVALNGSAALLHVVALRYGPLTVVQPLGALTLVAAVPLGARMAGRRVTTAEWRGTAFTLAGLGGLLMVASGPAPEQVLGPVEALAIAGATAVLIGALSRPGSRPGLRHATASGVASGVASALTQTVTVAATDHSGPLLSARVLLLALLVAAFATSGLLLSQTAYRGGLGAPLAVVTLANPVAAAAIGLTLLGQGLRGGAAGVLLALAGAAMAASGVVALSRATPHPEEADVSGAGRHGAVHDGGHEEHPVAAVLALDPEPAVPEAGLLPGPSGPGRLTVR
ncbi:DMT family transporter [Streptomyces tropicalis]|uniref:DMT family transporter n=1 Tax=Streptomyces tropicalis TaxID=3034234 RepID=A0ABT6ACC9_9ACTN|nr:DMT family transporter [Streptomyces tropicalis]MDF3302118.1 DMT family transporter [Streptomyces tropicalis]